MMNTKLTLRKSAIVGFSAMVLSMLAFSAEASPLLLNGSFEMTTPTSSFALAAGTTDLKNWTVDGPLLNPGNGIACVVFPGTADTKPCGNTFGPLWPGVTESPDRGNFIAADGDPLFADTLSQPITGLVKGQSYIVSFWQGAAQFKFHDGATTEWWLVSLGNQHISSDVMNNQEHGFVDWRKKYLTFTAEVDGTDVLKFFAAGTPGGAPPTVLLDGVSVTAVPEPATLGLLGVGLLGVLFARRLQKKRA